MLTLAAMGVLVLLLAVLPADQDRSLSFKLMLLMLPMMPAVCLDRAAGGRAAGRRAVRASRGGTDRAQRVSDRRGLVFYAGLMTDRVAAAYLVGAAAVVASLVQILWSLWACGGG